MKRSVKSTQLNVKQFELIKTGLGTPALLGPASMQCSIVKNGVGDYTISWSPAFRQSPVVIPASSVEDVYTFIKAITNSSARIITKGISASAILDLTNDITLVPRVGIDPTSKQGDKVTLQVLAAAANPTNTILMAVTGDKNAVVITITPNNGTNNAATPVALTTAQLALAIAGKVTGVYGTKNVTITDAGALLDAFTASGGGAAALADSGEGDGVVAEFDTITGAVEGDFHVLIVGSEYPDRF